MATYTKTNQGDLLALQSVAASSVVVGSAKDVSTALGGMCYARIGRRSATAAGAVSNLRLEASYATSGDNSWFPFAILSGDFAACEAEAVTGTVAAGATTITCASTTNLTAGDVIFIDNGTIGNSEWARIKSIVANTSVTVEDALVNAATSCTMYDSATIFSPVAIPPQALRIRAVADGSLFTQAWAVQVKYSTIDSIA